MRTPLVFAALVFAAFLSSCSSETPSNIRPEVSRPLNEAVLLSYQSSDLLAMAKLSQAKSVPDLNKDEQDKIRKVADFLDSRPRNRAGGMAGNDISEIAGSTFGVP